MLHAVEVAMCRHQALVQKPADAFTDSPSSVKAVKRPVVSASNRQTSARETVRGVTVSRISRSIARAEGAKTRPDDPIVAIVASSRSRCTIAGLFLMLGPLDHSLVRGAESLQERVGAFSGKELQAPMRLQGRKPCLEARFSRL
jgi:hypothetical protein